MSKAVRWQCNLLLKDAGSSSARSPVNKIPLVKLKVIQDDILSLKLSRSQLRIGYVYELCRSFQFPLFCMVCFIYSLILLTVLTVFTKDKSCLRRDVKEEIIKEIRQRLDILSTKSECCESGK